MVLRTRKENKGFFMACLGKPACDHAIWLDNVIREITPGEPCARCAGGSNTVQIRFRTPTCLALLVHDRINDNGIYESCLQCDHSLRNVLNMDVRQAHSTNNNPGNANRANDWARPTHPAPSNRNQPSRSRNPPANAGRSSDHSFGAGPSRANTSNANQSFGDDENVRCQKCNQPATK